MSELLEEKMRQDRTTILETGVCEVYMTPFVHVMVGMEAQGGPG